MKKNFLIWIIQTGEPLPVDGKKARPMRAINLFNELQKNNTEVLLISSRFCHQQKKQRAGPSKRRIGKNSSIVLLPSPGYKKNISLMRFIDHFQLGKSIKLYFKKTVEKPDLIFIGFPPIEIAYEAVKYCKQNKIPCILDIKDQWPDTFQNIVPKGFRPITKMLFKSFYKKAEYCFKNASSICSITPEFYKWALKKVKRKPIKADIIVPLKPKINKINKQDIKKADKWWDAKNISKSRKKLRICFAGNFGKFTELEKTVKWIETFNESNRPQIELIICGDGDNFEVLKTMCKKDKNIKIMGRLDYSKVISLYKRCAAMIAPIRRTSDYQSSIPNKVHEGVAYGLPIITSLTGSTKQYLNKMKKGIFYDPSSQKSFTKALKIFLKWKCKNQSRQIYLEKELKDNYKQLCNKILAMAN